MTEEIEIQVPPELRQIQQTQFAVAIGDKLYQLSPLERNVTELESVAKVFATAGFADLRMRYQQAVKESINGLDRLLSILPTPKQALEADMRVGSDGRYLSTTLPFKLKVTHLLNRKILEPKIEFDIYIQFKVRFFLDTLRVDAAELMTLDNGIWRQFKHYHNTGGGTCWGSYGASEQKIGCLMDLLPIRDRCEQMLHNVGHSIAQTRFMNCGDMPPVNSLKLGKKRKIMMVGKE